MLPEGSISIGQKLAENAKLEHFKCDIFGDFQRLLFLKDLHGHLNKVQDHQYQDKVGKVMIMELGQGMEVDQVLPGGSRKTKLSDKPINLKVRNLDFNKLLK